MKFGDDPSKTKKLFRFYIIYRTENYIKLEKFSSSKIFQKTNILYPLMRYSGSCRAKIHTHDVHSQSSYAILQLLFTGNLGAAMLP